MVNGYGFDYKIVNENSEDDENFSNFVLEAAQDAAINLADYNDMYGGNKLRDAVSRGVISIEDIIKEFADQIRHSLNG